MIAKATRTTLIIALFSLAGLTIPAGVSQTAIAQDVTEDAVRSTLLEGFFDDESNEEEVADTTESQENDQQQDQDQDASLHDVPQDNTANFGDDDADNTGVQDQDQDQDQNADQRAANIALKLALGL